ncbi:hypothetical protein [Saccharopolyspora gregorii]|uniref:hypothetical protein n=1 Tax=Saccharopolyspora gregorii TaxID=33914 RepID=UPI0021AD2EED|nr:hypothetical protein [Saccharopolyspora gregorii]
MGYEVVTKALEDAAKAARSAAEQARSVRLEPATDKIAEAMPGSVSAPAAERTGGSWRGSLDGWNRDVEHYADSLSGSARDYDGREGAAADGLNATQGGGA